MEEHRDAYESENPFFVPKGARWKYYIKSQAKQTTIGIKIVRNEDELMIYIYMILLSLVIVFEAKITNHSVKSSSMIERLDIILILSMIIQVFFTIYIFVITINGLDENFVIKNIYLLVIIYSINLLFVKLISVKSIKMYNIIYSYNNLISYRDINLTHPSLRIPSNIKIIAVATMLFYVDLKILFMVWK